MNPWSSIWFHPIETLKTLVKTNVNKGLFFFYFVSGFIAIFNMIGYHTQPKSFVLMFLINILLAFPVGLIYLNIEAGIIFIFTRIFKSGNHQENQFKSVRACVAWSWYPRLILFLIVLIASGALFIYDPSIREGAANQVFTRYPVFTWIVGTLTLISSIWSLVILIGGISGVLGINGWKAFVAFILYVIVFIIILAVVFTITDQTMGPKEGSLTFLFPGGRL